MPDVDNLLTTFYSLTDESRSEIIEQIMIKKKHGTDPERLKEVKSIQNWK